MEKGEINQAETYIATGKEGITNMHKRMRNVVFKGLLTQGSLVEITNQRFSGDFRKRTLSDATQPDKPFQQGLLTLASCENVK